MSIKDVDAVITRFVNSKKTEVLAISGDWGVGKTYAISKMLKAFTTADVPDALEHYSYVSLFGLNSMSELRTRIWTARVRFPIIDDDNVAKVEDSKKFLDMDIVKKLGAVFAKEIPYAKSIVVGVESVVQKLIHGTIVWFDDLERLGPGIKIEDFMGLVSELKEQLNCKVIIVYNGKQLGDKAGVFNTYSEKVIDQKLLFEIGVEDAITHGLPSKTPLREMVAPYIRILNVRNIRIVQRMSNGLEYIYPKVKTNSAYVHGRVAQAVAVFTVSMFEGARGFPPPEKLLKYSYLNQEADEGAQVQNAVNWKQMFADCDFKYADALDKAVYQSLEQGYAASTIQSEAAIFDAAQEDSDRERLFTAAWESFHFQFDTDENQLADKFVEAVKEGAKFISPGNMSGTVTLMREIGFGDKANELIELYIGGCEDKVEKFLPRHWRLFTENIDPTLENRMAEALAEKKKTISLDDAADMVLGDKDWNDDALDAFSVATKDQLLALLEKHQGRRLSTLMTKISGLNVGESRNQLRGNLDAALAEIEGKSELNKLRVRRWRTALW